MLSFWVYIISNILATYKICLLESWLSEKFFKNKKSSKYSLYVNGVWRFLLKLTQFQLESRSFHGSPRIKRSARTRITTNSTTDCWRRRHESIVLKKQHFDVNRDSERLTDAIIHTRITNDERPLRRVVKKFHNYASLVHHPFVPLGSSSGTVEDAREAFLIELASFELALKKSMMVCEAERRQVEEYQREREKIGEWNWTSHESGCLKFAKTFSEKEHDALRGQIDELKVALEHAHMERKRKVEYDLIAEKINTLPSRDELEQSVILVVQLTLMCSH